MKPVFAFLLAALLAWGAAFEVSVTGEGARAMILIPGLASSGDVWTGTVAHFRDRYQCHVLTLAGFAGVEPEKDAGRLPDRAVDAVARYIREKKLARPVIAGHSLGGVVALALAARHPELAGDLVIVDALPNLGAVFGPGYDAAAFRDRMLKLTREDYDTFVKSGVSVRGMVTGDRHLPQLIEWSLRSDPATVAHAMFDIGTQDLTAELPKIRARALVLGTWVGMKEFTTRDIVEGNFRKQYAGLKGHQFTLAEKARHFIMLDDPAWFHAQLDAFLEPKAR